MMPQMAEGTVCSRYGGSMMMPNVAGGGGEHQQERQSGDEQNQPGFSACEGVHATEQHRGITAMRPQDPESSSEAQRRGLVAPARGVILTRSVRAFQCFLHQGHAFLYPLAQRALELRLPRAQRE